MSAREAKTFDSALSALVQQAHSESGGHLFSEEGIEHGLESVKAAAELAAATDELEAAVARFTNAAAKAATHINKGYTEEPKGVDGPLIEIYGAAYQSAQLAAEELAAFGDDKVKS